MMETFWFIIEPYVYIELTDTGVFNALNNNYFITDDEEI
jgi:hypothetical protein